MWVKKKHTRICHCARLVTCQLRSYGELSAVALIALKEEDEKEEKNNHNNTHTHTLTYERKNVLTLINTFILRNQKIERKKLSLEICT